MKYFLLLCLLINVAIADVNVGVVERVKSVTTNYTALITDDNIFVDATSGAVTVSLPSASAKKGKVIKVIKSDSTSNAVTVGSSVLSIGGIATVVSNGTVWAVTNLTNGGAVEKVTSVSANYTALITDDNVFVDATGGARAIALPSASAKTGKFIKIIKSDSSTNAVTVTGVIILPRSGSSVRVLSTGSAWVVDKTNIPPTQQTFGSGSGTYTTPAGVLYIIVKMVGGGGGGGGGDSFPPGASGGGTGGTTTFGTSLITALGGDGAGYSGACSQGSTANSPAVAVKRFTSCGDSGVYHSSMNYAPSGTGGASPWHGGGRVVNTNVGQPGSQGSGGAGGSGGNTNPSLGGGGGGSGSYIEAQISSPSSTYSYSIGSSGAAGSGVAGGFGAGGGGLGYIEVNEYYQ